MTQSHSIRVLTRISASTCGVFEGAAAVAGGVTRRQLVDLVAAGVVERVLPDTYRLTAAPRSRLQRLHAALRRLLDELDPVHPSRSTLEVKTRRLLVAHGLTSFTREFPLEWNGRPYYFDFAFTDRYTILETNGRRWHDDPADYEFDNEKWSVPGRHGYKLVMATKYKVTKQPHLFVCELRTTLDASPPRS